MQNLKLAYSDPRSYVWKKNTLYHDHYDTEVTVLAMIEQGLPRIKIQDTIQTLFADGAIDEAKRNSLMELVKSLSGGLLDTDKVKFSANAEFIAKGTQNVAAGMSIPEAEAALRQREERFCKLWDEPAGAYRRYDELGRPPPSQYLAMQQLKYRVEHKVPILVAIAAPAGYGKSEIIMAWLMYLQTLAEPPIWHVLAVTGVAAANAGGTTVHAFFRLRKNEKSAIFKDPEAQE